MSVGGPAPAAFSSASAKPQGPWFRALAEGVRSGVVILDCSGRPVYANRAAVELLCSSAKSESPESCARDDLSAVEAMMPAPLTTACRDQRLPTEGEVSVTVGEHVRAIRLNCVPLDDVSKGALVFVEDRTQRSILDESLALASRARSMVRAEIHDLRAPLNALGLTASMLRDSLEAEPAKDEAVREEQVASAVILQREVARLDRMLESFLKNTEGRRTLRRGRVELGRLARSVGRLVRASARPRGVKVRLDVNADAEGREGERASVLVRGDRDRLRQALLNVVVNALEASPDGGELRLRVRGGARPRIEVEDDGPGIPPRLRQRVFDLSFTTKREGSGIGLTVSRSLVESMGGELRIANGPHGGAIVEISLRSVNEEEPE